MSGSINSNAINVTSVNSDSLVIIGTGVGELISFEQIVAVIESGELISFEQEILLRLSSTVSESMISIEQVCQALYSDSELINIEQKVKDSAVLSHVSRTGWDLTLVIGGYEVPNEQIHGSISISRTESDAALMNITLIPPSGIQNLELYHGKAVTLDVETSTGIQRLYTGTIDIPHVDIIQEKVTLKCSDRRTEQLNGQLPGIVNTIGVYSPHIFNEASDTAELVQQRLTTTPTAVDFDAYGNYTITSWFAKSTADFTLTDSDVYRNKPKVEFASRGRVTNKVNINLQYRYERFHHGTRTFVWESPIKDDICKLLQFGYTMTFKSMVQSAADSAGWPIKNDINFDPLPAAGWYSCGGNNIAWSTIQLQGVNEAVVDTNGDAVTDINGNALFETRITGGTDYGGLYCVGANWQATNQWSQNITENYSLSLSSSQSIAQFGTITQDFSYAIDEEADVSGWENYTSFRTTQAGNNYADDQDIKRNEFNVATDAALRQGKTTILGSHRDTRVIVDTKIWPEIDLKHTVLVDTDELEAKGKVFNITHRLNIGTGEAVTTTTLVLFRAQGSSSDSALSLPVQVTDNVTYNGGQINLGNHFGEDPTTPQAALWNGMIGNRWKTENNNLFNTTFTPQFIVDVPAIPSSLRTSKSLNGSNTYNVAIPNDTLIITFDGVS